MALRKIATIAALTLFAAGAASAADFPSRPITVVVPYSAGGTSDGQMRMIQEALSKELGQPVVIDNKAGASGAIGAQHVARSKPDGYTLLYPNNGVLTAPLLSDSLSYDPFRDFTPVSMVSAVPMVLVANNKVPAKDVKSFLEYAAKQPDGIMYASAGPGSYGHLSTMRLAQMAGIEVTHIPYKGEAATTLAVRSGEVQMLLTTPSSAMLGQIEQGNLTLLGVGTAEPTPVLPDAPTLGETLPGYVAEVWFGLLAPAGTPDAVVEKLNAAVRKVMEDESLQQRFLATGAVPRTSTAAEYGEIMRKDNKILSELISQSNLKAD